MEEEKNTVEPEKKDDLDEMLSGAIDGMKKSMEQLHKGAALSRQMGLALSAYGQCMACGGGIPRGLLMLLKAALEGAGCALADILREMDGRREDVWS